MHVKQNKETIATFCCRDSKKSGKSWNGKKYFWMPEIFELNNHFEEGRGSSEFSDRQNSKDKISILIQFTDKIKAFSLLELCNGMRR